MNLINPYLLIELLWKYNNYPVINIIISGNIQPNISELVSIQINLWYKFFTRV